jgi:hypothetical protein
MVKSSVPEMSQLSPNMPLGVRSPDCCYVRDSARRRWAARGGAVRGGARAASGPADLLCAAQLRQEIV